MSNKSQNLTSPAILVDADTIKANVPAVVSMIKKTLNVGCKPSHALDIASVGAGFNDYQTAKGLKNKDHWVAKANLGTQNSPFYVERELGFFDDWDDAIQCAKETLSDCCHVIHWEIHRNEVCMTHLYSGVISGHLNVEVSLEGDDWSDIEAGLAEVKRLIGEEYRSGINDGENNRHYDFQVYGEVRLPNIYSNTPSEALIDDNGWVENIGNDYQAEFEAAGNGDGLDKWEGSLRLLEAVELDYDEYGSRLSDLEWNDQVIYTDDNGLIVFEGDYEDAVNELKESVMPYHLFKVVEIKH